MINMRLFCFICLVAGIVFTGAAIVLTVAFTFTIGNAIALAAGISFLLLYWIYPRLTNRLRLFMNIFLIGLGIYMIGMFIFIGSQGEKNTATFTEDCVLVLGGGLLGEKIVPTLQLRLDKCIEYLHRNPAALILVSGGKGGGETICESLAMKRYLVSKGVDADRIIEENQSRNTRQNMQYSKALLDAHFPSGNYTVACITSDFHAYRADRLAKAVNLLVSHYNARTKWYLYPSSYCKETLSIIKMWSGY